MSALIARARRVLGAQRSGRPGIGRALIGFVLLCSIVAPVWFMADDRLRERRVAEQVGKVEQFRDQQLAVVDGWVSDLLTDARFWAGDATIVESTQRLLGQRGAELLSSSALATIRARLGAFLELNELSGFFVIAPDGTSLASSRNGNIGTPNLVAQDHPEVFAAVLAGETLVTPVQPTDVPISDELRDVETFFVAAPIVDRGAVIAVLTLRVVPQLDLPSVKARSATFEGFSWVVFSADGTATTGAGEIEPLDELFFGGTPASTVLVDRPVGTNVDDGDRDVVDRIEAWAVSDQIGLGVVAVQDGDDAFAPLQSERRGFALVALSILAVGGVLVVVAQLAWSRYRSREELETTRQRVRDLIDPSPDAIFRLRRDGVVLGANETADALAGGAARGGAWWETAADADHLGRESLAELGERHPLLRALALEWAEVANESERAAVERLHVEVDGRHTYHRVRWVPLVETDGEVLVVISDVTAVVERELELERLARVDPLTGLDNRAAIAAHLGTALGRLSRSRDRSGIAVAMIDLDRFKPVNDLHGHAAGDAVLQQVSRELTAELRTHDSLGRLGGDEFMIVCEGVRDAHDAERIATRIARRLTALQVDIEHASVSDASAVEVGGSVGVAWTTEPLDAGVLMELADDRLLATKRDRQGPRSLVVEATPSVAASR